MSIIWTNVLLLVGVDSYPPYRRGEVVNVREGMNCVGRIRSAGNMLWYEAGIPRIDPVSVCFNHGQSVSYR